MAWRFKASKYKNASPIVPKFENLIRDLSIGSYRSHGNFIAASGAFMAFNWETNGSNLALLPLDAKGRQSKAKIPLIYAHSDFVTDFQFSPFDDGLLATASQDLTIKLWRIPEKGLNESGLNQPELVLPSQPRRVETVNFHSTADCVLATTSANSLVVWDLIQAKELFNYQDHDDEIQSVAWQHNGKLLATQSKDKQLRILDPRSGKCVVQCESHQGIKDSKVVWINGSGNRLFTTGFSGDRRREITIRDLRNLDAPQQNLTLDSSAGILIPLYDPDTNMCFLAGKGDRNVQFIELSDKEPFIIEGLKYSGEQTKGACLVPKRVLDVMQGEVNRVLQLCDSSIVPITWQVPRKSYRDYHADIYPETNGLDASCGPSTWWQGHDDLPVSKMSLDPRKRSKENLVVFQGPLSDRDPNKKTENGLHTNGNNGSANNNTTASANNNPRFAKPTPRTRCVVTANSVSVSSTNPKPSIVPQVS
jgi:coronin-7